MIIHDLQCDFPCDDINRDLIFPKLDMDPDVFKIIMISEAPPVDHANYFYTGTSGSFFQTTKTAFWDAGVPINDYDDLTKMGIYLTTAIKCSKKDYLVSATTIKACSKLLEKELAQFPNIKVIMCMGDFAIKAVNYGSHVVHRVRRTGARGLVPLYGRLCPTHEGSALPSCSRRVHPTVGDRVGYHWVGAHSVGVQIARYISPKKN